ncbi:MAG: glycoside hydrolase family 3 C-terminal domain-containing protein, partial [Firmicutes bacterium]|nr:glycoside hydrolase family 3 C-terminal domain-containing protein [Bacillota bacterium]
MKKVVKRYWHSLITIVAGFVLVFTGMALSFSNFGTVGKADAFVLDEGITGRDQARANANAVSGQIAEEGMVLLKNGLVGSAPALPLTEAKPKVTIFGKNISKLRMGGSGSSGAGAGGGVDALPNALKTNDAFDVNPSTIDFYRGSSSGSGLDTDVTGGSTVTYWSLRVGETPVGNYTDTIKNTFANYNDAALIVFSRLGGEAFDLPRTSYSTKEGTPSGKQAERDSASEHYLQLTNDEKDLIKMVKASGFKKTVLLLNTGTSFELDFVDSEDLGVDAVLHMGFMGSNGLVALPKLLKGVVSPSAKTTDLFSKNFKSDPVWMNFGANLVNNGNAYSANTERRTVAYREGIYQGYRYYETRDFTDTAFNYDEYVKYPFGYGLSYTNFEWEVTGAAGALTKDATISVDVKVTNKGNAPGKDVVELYYSAPYKPGGIEKSHVVLGAFEKTKTLAKDEAQTLRLSLPARQMASWDMEAGNYVLESGNYDIYVGTDSHQAWKNPARKLTFTVAQDIRYTESSTGYKYENQFDESNQYHTASAQYGKLAFENALPKVMSRSDWTGTYPTTFSGTQLSVATSAWLPSASSILADSASVGGAPVPWSASVVPAVGQANGVMLGDLYGLAYDDPKWDDFLDQLTVAQMRNAIGKGGFRTGDAIEAIGVFATVTPDGPLGFTGQGTSNTCTYPSPYFVACTWNKELAEKQGDAIGNEGVAGGIAGMYGPAMNIHRSPFSGRNFEYYSEDSYLSGKIGAAVVKGMQRKGVIAFVKHFALNDQETNRDSPNGLITWANEQTIRENYLETFRYAVMEGGATGMMSAFNRIGLAWCGTHYRLLNNVLRKEWGFNGCVVTDWDQGYMNSTQMIRAGNDLYLQQKLPSEDTNATHRTALRTACHNIYYAVAHSNASIAYANGQKLKIELVKGGAVNIDLKPRRYARNSTTPVNVTFEAVLAGTLPAGLSFDAATAKLTGTAPQTDIDGVKITVTATEGTKRMATNVFTIGAVDSIVIPPVECSVCGNNPCTCETEPVEGAPSAPRNLKATPGDKKVDLKWAAPLDNAANITKYEVSGDNGATWADAGKELKYSFTGLENGKEYTFKVRAVNPAGTGAEVSVKAKAGAKSGGCCGGG